MQLTVRLKFGSKDRKNSDNVLSLDAPTCCLYADTHIQKYISVKANWGYSTSWFMNHNICITCDCKVEFYECRYGWSITSLVGCKTSLSPVEAKGQSPSQAEWSPPEVVKQTKQVTSSEVHDFRDTWIFQKWSVCHDHRESWFFHTGFWQLTVLDSLSSDCVFGLKKNNHRACIWRLYHNNRNISICTILLMPNAHTFTVLQRLWMF